MIQQRLTGTALLNRINRLAWAAARKADEIRANPARRHQAPLLDSSVRFWRDLHAVVENGWTLTEQQAQALAYIATAKETATVGRVAP